MPGGASAGVHRPRNRKRAHPRTVISPSRMPHDLLANPALAAAYADFLTREEQDAEQYVERMAHQMRERGLAIETLVRRGTPATILLELEDALRVGLVVMTTHARAGMAHTALGSVADQLIHHGQVPVLLVRPFVAKSRCAELTRADPPEPVTLTRWGRKWG